MDCVVCLLRGEDNLRHANFQAYGHSVCEIHVPDVVKCGGELRVIRRIGGWKVRGATTFGEGVKALRNAKGWSQQELSKQAGVVQSAVSSIEQGKREPGDDVKGRLLRALGATEEEAMGE